MFEYLKFSLTVIATACKIVWKYHLGSSRSCLALLPLSRSHQKIVQNSVLRHVHEHVVHLFIPCLGVSVCIQVRHMDVVDSHGYFKRQSIVPALTQVK